LDDLALSALSYKLSEGGVDLIGNAFCNVPLGGGGKRNGSALLELFLTVERKAGSVLERADDRPGRRIVFVISHTGRGGRP
jgi:hypothetical protein